MWGGGNVRGARGCGARSQDVWLGAGEVCLCGDGVQCVPVGAADGDPDLPSAGVGVGVLCHAE